MRGPVKDIGERIKNAYDFSDNISRNVRQIKGPQHETGSGINHRTAGGDRMRTGTIRNQVKLQVMEYKWQQKKENIGQKKREEMTPQERMLQNFQEQAEEIQKSRENAKISAKIKSGGTLTPEEEQYLKQNNPGALKEYEEIKKERESYERQLENCRTKEETERLKLQKMGSFLAQAKSISNNPYIPEGKKAALLGKILAQVTNVAQAHEEFVRSAAYQNLPSEEELAEEAKEKNEWKEPEESEASEDQVQAEEPVQPEETGPLEEAAQPGGTGPLEEAAQTGGTAALEAAQRKEPVLPQDAVKRKNPGRAEAAYREVPQTEAGTFWDMGKNLSFEQVETEIRDYIRRGSKDTGNIDISV